MNRKSENVANSNLYKDQCRKIDGLFDEQNQTSVREHKVSNGFVVLETMYSAELDGCTYGISFCKLKNEEGAGLAEWKCYDNSASFYTLIAHQNGDRYLVFRQDLYGFSILNLSDYGIYQYYPQCVFQGEEDFIWTAVHYNTITSMLAVEGCYWACPNSVLLVDFSNPTCSSLKQADVLQYLEGGYDTVDDADFVRWENTSLVLSCYDTELDAQKEVKLVCETYSTWLKL